MRNTTLAVSFLLLLPLAYGAEAKHPWASFKPGSYSKMKTTTMAGPSKTVTEMTQTLISVDANTAVVETETKVMGQSSKTRVNIPLKAAATPANAAQAKAPTPVNETITVAGKAHWSAVKLDDKHIRLTLIDPGYLDPSDRTVDILFQHLRPKKCIDILSGETLQFNGGKLSITIPAGVFRMIDVELE